MLLKRRLNKEDSSTRLVLRLPVLRGKSDSKKLERKLRPEDLLMRPKSRDKELKKKPDTKNGAMNKRDLDSKLKRLLRLDSLRRKLLESLGSKSKKSADSKERLLSNLLLPKEKSVKLRLELLLKNNAKKGRLNLNNGESREKLRLSAEELSKKT